MNKEKEAREEYETNFGSLDLEKSYRNLFELLWYSHLPCFGIQNITSLRKNERSVVKSCSWKGLQLSCSSMFTQIPTDRGMCCSFNHAKVDSMFQHSIYADQIARMQKQDETRAFENPDLLDWFGQQNEPIPRLGQENGLKLILDSNIERVSSASIGDDFRGFTALIEDSKNYPLTSRSSFILRPGNENNIALLFYR